MLQIPHSLSVRSIFRFRLFPVVLIAALLAPTMIFVADAAKARAEGATKSIPAPPPAAPPEPFLTTHSAGGFSLARSVAAAASNLGAFALAILARFGNEVPQANMEEQAEPLPTAMGPVRFDFDGDGKADIGRWQPGNTRFEVKNSGNGASSVTIIGSSSAKPVPGDFDGDGKTDAAVFNSGLWTIRYSSNGSTQGIQFGLAGDVPVSGDYDGDGKTDVSIYRPSTGTWWILLSSTGGYTATQFGISSDIPASGDYDGDGKSDIAVYRPSTGVWYLQRSLLGFYATTFGISIDIPVPADFDGDGKTDIAVYRPSDGTWWALKSSTGNAQWMVETWGNFGDQPAPADYDGDGKADFVVWTPDTGVWHIFRSSDLAFENRTLGIPGDTAIPSAYLKQTGAQIATQAMAAARLSPRNATGGTNPFSGNFGWGTSLVGLPGRGGLDAGFGLSYNSLVWTREGNNVYFDADAGNVSPGFRIGFPTLERAYYVPGSGGASPYYAYIMVMPSGQRVEFRQIGVSNVFETADSSYLQLKTISPPSPNDQVETVGITVFGTDGTQMKYEWKGGAFRCQQIKDKNGNFISINHDEFGALRTVTDTVGRVVTVNYDQELYPTSVTQTWKNNNGSGADVAHTWASLSYADIQISTNFQGVGVVGPQNGWYLKVLDRVNYADGSSTRFTYNSYGQVWKIANYAADNHLLNYVRTNLESPAPNQTDVPRFSETRSWVENFNGGNETVITNTLTAGAQYSLPGGIAGTAMKIETSMAGHPSGSVTKTYVGETGWIEGLPIATEDWADDGTGFQRKRWTWTNWTQDDPGSARIMNPRVVETRVDDITNVKRTTVEYLLTGPGSTVSVFGLASAANIFDADLSTVLKRTETDYNLAAVYLDRRIIGLPAETRLFGKNDLTGQLELAARVSNSYDEGSFSEEPNQQPAPFGHDTANYGAGFIVGRGNSTSVTRHDVLSESAAVTTRTRYDIAGSVVAQYDALNRRVGIDYADNYNSVGSPAGFAYPTRVTDPAGNFSEVKYRYDIGANVRAQSPAPAGNVQGKITERSFDSVGRIERETVMNTGAYTRYEYPANGIQTKAFSTLVDTNGNGADFADEAITESWVDGAGRVRMSRAEHPGSIGGWAGVLTEYDILGRVKRQSVPTEVDVNWIPAGDDATRGWLWTYQKYDWKGRVVRKINTDGVDSPVLNDSDVLISYDGCGCAGGQVTTVQGELVERDDQPGVFARRTRRVYEDLLGREWKTEAMNWDGATVYSTVTNSFNGRDQVVRGRQFAGPDTSPTYQDTTASFDGHGRLKTRHLPQQDAGKSTVYNYNADDSISSVTDARGAVTQYTYNSIGLLEGTSWTVPPGSNIPVTAAVSLAYDAVGNRTSMTDGLGTAVYEYDELSRMTAETRNFTDALPNAPLPGNGFRLEYGYQLGGQLKSLTDPFGQRIDYGYDKTARLQDVTSSPYGANNVTGYATGAKYRAWGGLKELNNGNGMRMTQTFDTRLRAETYQLTGAAGQVMSKSYEYNADGSASYSQDMINPKFDRLNTYDSEGRIRTAKSSAEARGQQITIDSQQKTDLPYRESYQFNAFGNLTGRTNLHWSFPNDVAYNYQNNRITNQFWSYDADGRLLQNALPDSDATTFTHDAAGRLTKSDRWDQSARFETNSFLDAEGRETKHWTQQWELLEPGTIDPNIPPASVVKYNIRSSVLGGETVSVATETGKKERTYIHAAGIRVAQQNPYTDLSGNVIGRVTWEHRDASGLSGRSSYENGSAETFEGGLFSPVEADAIGNNMGTRTPYLEPPPGSGGSPEMEFDYRDQETYINGQQITCTLDGVPVKCSIVSSLPNGSIEDVRTYGVSTLGLFQLGIIERVTVLDEPDVPSKPDPDTGEELFTVKTSIKVEWEVRWQPSQRKTQTETDEQRRQRLFNEAVNATRNILSNSNACSKFFGEFGLLAFNQLIQNPIFGELDNARTGITQSLTIPIFHKSRLPIIDSNGYRSPLYDFITPKSFTVNTKGAFFNSNSSLPSFGRFAAGSLKNRVLQLLHELGHVTISGLSTRGLKKNIIKRGFFRGELLLKEDGDDTSLSEKNTNIVLNNCKNEINAVVDQQTN